MNRTSRIWPWMIAVSAASLLVSGAWVSAGVLTPPPGPVSPTMKTLDQVEPRTPISSLPFSIDSSGSYYLTGNLTGIAGQNGITVNASPVTIDLSGYALTGVAGSLDGIFVASSSTILVVRNGVIRNWGGRGITAINAVQSQVADVQASANGADGMYISGYGVVERCTSNLNGAAGIVTSSGNSTISGCTVANNASHGIQAGGVVIGCTVVVNGGVGLLMGGGSTIEDCTVSSSGSAGIQTGLEGTIRNCVVRSGGADGIRAGIGSLVMNCTASNNNTDGIEVDSGCLVLNNTCYSNGNGVNDGAGIHCTGGDNRIDGNNVIDNDRGIDCNPATGNLVIRNSASGNTTINYDLAAGNTAGPIVTSATIAADNNPHANYGF